MQPTPAGARVQANGLSLRGPRGWVYHDVTFAAAPGTLVAIEGPAGSGRTSLLLTLAGRMAPSTGTARVDRHTIPERMADVQRIAALGVMPKVNELEPALTVAEQYRERELLYLRWRLHPDVLAALQTWVGADVETLVHQLDPRRQQLLGLAMALVSNPALVLVDDVDAGLATGNQLLLWEALQTVSAHGITVLATTTDAGMASELVDDVVRVAA